MKLINRLVERLVVFEINQFTGVVTIASSGSQQWNMYFYKGIILWAEGGTHGYRFWLRHLSTIYSQDNIRLFDRERVVQNNNSDYYFVHALVKNELLTRSKIRALIKLRIKNILFDIFQLSEQESLKIVSKSQSSYQSLKNNFNLALSDWKFRDLLVETYQNWLSWQKKGLSLYSPNLAPVLCLNPNLSRQVSPLALKNMQIMFNGQNTLRDVAVQMDKDVADVIQALVPFVKRRYVQLLEVPDLSMTNFSISA